MELTIFPFWVYTVWLMSHFWDAMRYNTVLFAGKARPIMTLQCRFYANRFPEVDDVVMVNVRCVAEMGVYVTLLEYDNIEAMIPLSELSRRRIRSVNKLIRVNSNEAVVVIRVDENKGTNTFIRYIKTKTNVSEKTGIYVHTNNFSANLIKIG